MLKILGLESSCDDSCAAIIDEERILANIVINQHNEHLLYRGVVPEIAARSHLRNISTALDLALAESGTALTSIDAVAATCGPGLIGGVIIGSIFGKALASVLKKPFIAINHLEGHALTAQLTNQIDFPYLLLLASGGHCQFIAVLGLGHYKILGQTLDDAAGEAFDKVAKMMKLGFPGGPLIEQLAKEGDPHRFNLPKPLIRQADCNLSFSGLKTAVKLQLDQLGDLTEQDKKDMAASFQRTINEILTQKTKFAINKYEYLLTNEILLTNFTGPKNFVVAGGVAANQELRRHLALVSSDRNYHFTAPPINLCTDNAAMIAFAGLERLKNAKINDVNFKPRARWSLEDL